MDTETRMTEVDDTQIDYYSSTDTESGGLEASTVWLLEDLGSVDFVRSGWFARGWMVQGLMAPFDVILYDCKWIMIGSKYVLAGLISRALGIDRRYLQGRFILENNCIAEKMSWILYRQVLGKEDIAYYLLGLSDVNIP